MYSIDQQPNAKQTTHLCASKIITEINQISESYQSYSSPKIEARGSLKCASKRRDGKFRAKRGPSKLTINLNFQLIFPAKIGSAKC
jgi:hypothetical protein